MKAAEEMTREQKEVKLRMILQDYHRRNDYELQQAMNDILALDALPPAEGAEEILHKYVHTINSDGTSLVTFMGALKAMREFAAQQQPTAEGAEEIDDETIAYAAEYQCGTPFSERWIGFVKGAKWHRSLHAQRIADKMVSERDDKLLQQRDELKEALAEQKRLYFSLFDEETSCMYCEAKIRRGSAIILCKECAESTEV